MGMDIIIIIIIIICVYRGKEVVKLQQSLRVGAGVLDIHWESPNELLTGGYDTYLRLWDIRYVLSVNDFIKIIVS